jgi:trehalose 6-phosphate synthase
MLRALRPDVRISHFSHTPWVDAALINVLPESVVGEILEGMAGAHALGFHSPRWADAFEACWSTHPSTCSLPTPDTFVAPAAADHLAVLDAMASPAFGERRAEIEALVQERKCIVRIDRMEPSKNLLGGFRAFAALLETHPEWQGAVNFLAVAYPSRGSLEEYRRYRCEVEAEVAAVNARFGTNEWTPITLITEEGYTRAVAMLQRADVVFVNPIRDGLNLVVYEAQTATERDSVLVLSRETGAWDELGPAGAIGVNPFDECDQVDALHRALSMTTAERRERGQRLCAVATARTPGMWLAQQIEAAAEAPVAHVHVLNLRTASGDSSEPVAVSGPS